MRRFYTYLIPIFIAIAILFIAFAVIQTKSEQRQSLHDMKEKVNLIANAAYPSAWYILENNSSHISSELIEKINKVDKSIGFVISKNDGIIINRSQNISDELVLECGKLQKEAIDSNSHASIHKMVVVLKSRFYVYTLPVFNKKGALLGSIALTEKINPITPHLVHMWLKLVALLFATFAIIIIAFIILHLILYVLPIRKMTKWFTKFRKGEDENLKPINKTGMLTNLISEIEQIALTLRIANKKASKRAKYTIKNEEVWDLAKLHNVIDAKLNEKTFIVVSNREPYAHVMGENGQVKCVRPAGGVVSALDPVISASGGTWIAHGDTELDKKFVNSQNKLGVPPENNKYILKRVWLSKDQVDGYYNGFSNEGLWPLCHLTHVKPIFRETDWQYYKEVNQIFADSVIEELPTGKTLVFIQDYHFTLIAKMIKEKRPDVTIALFWHIPWPATEAFSICPYYKDILEGMLSCDLIGFHIQGYCNNFLDSVNKLIESRIDNEKFSIFKDNKETFIRAFPISINTDNPQEDEDEMKDEINSIMEKYNLRGKTIALGVDRVDYTKGIIERLAAVNRLLEKYPEYREKFVLLQIGSPSRTDIDKYKELTKSIDELVKKINSTFKTETWEPIVYLRRHFSQDELKPIFTLSNICIVSSLHDGMNLVAKEYVIFKGDNGVLILSSFTGASKELVDALLINPYSTEEFADALKTAIDMPLEEQKMRMLNMKKIIEESNVYRWAGNIISELTTLKKI